MSFFMRSLLRTIPLIGALLLSASPAVADDFVYLKCQVSTKSTVFNWDKTKELNHWDSNTEILYKIDTKREVLFTSSKHENTIKYEWQHPGFIGWTEQISDERMSGKNVMYLQYDPPEYVDGAMYHSDRLRRLKYFGSMYGSCEGSDASAYEASK